MDLLVAGLQGIEPYGLYQYDSSVDRKGKTFDLLRPFMTVFQSAAQCLFYLEFV